MSKRNLATALVIASVAAVQAHASPAFAADSAADEAAAEAIFQEARRLVAAGDFASACPKFAESNRIAASVGALLSLGDCFERAHKLASGWGAFLAAGILAHAKSDVGREGEATKRAGLLAPRLAKLALVVPPAARVPGFELHRDGSLVGEAQWGSAMPVDTGQHEISATAPGYKTWTTTVRMETDSAATSLEIQPLDKVPVAALPAAEADGATQKTLGFALVGVGAAGLVLGAITLGLDAAKNGSLSQKCPMGQCPTSLQSTLQSDVSSYHTLGIVSSTSLVAGGALAVTGMIMVLVAPKTSPQATAVSPLVGPGYAGLVGRF